MDKENIDALINAGTVAAGYVLKVAADGIFGKDITKFFENLKSSTSDERQKNLSNIAEATIHKAERLGKDLPNSIPLRIAERLLNEGSYCADAVMQEYYAGVLLSSYDLNFDDQGVYYLSTIHRLSSVQLRAHYILYQIIKETFEGIDTSIIIPNHTIPSHSGLTQIAASSLIKGLYGKNLVDDESLDQAQQVNQYRDIIEYVVQGLRKENLIRSFFTVPVGYGFTSDDPNFPKTKNTYYFFAPTTEGIQLYLYGQGYGNTAIKDFLSDKVICPRLENIHIDNFKEYKADQSLFMHVAITGKHHERFDNE